MTNAKDAGTVLEGGCLCGAIRYRAREVLEQGPVHCHCITCRKSHSAPVVTWITVPAAAFELTAGTPRYFASSDHARRGFCPDCGSPLTFQSRHSPDEIDIAVGSLNDPELARPVAHIWVKRRLSWADLGKDLPEYREDR